MGFNIMDLMNGATRAAVEGVVHCMPYESIYDVMCGRRQFYDYRNEFITAVAEGLGMLPGSRTKRNTGCSSTTGT